MNWFESMLLCTIIIIIIMHKFVHAKHVIEHYSISAYHIVIQLKFILPRKAHSFILAWFCMYPIVAHLSYFLWIFDNTSSVLYNLLSEVASDPFCMIPMFVGHNFFGNDGHSNEEYLSQYSVVNSDSQGIRNKKDAIIISSSSVISL